MEGSVGTTLASGVAASVNGGGIGHSEGFASAKSAVSSAQNPTSISEQGEGTQNHEEKNEDIVSMPVEVRKDGSEGSKTPEFADDLFETAKADGVEVAFDKLASDQQIGSEEDHLPANSEEQGDRMVDSPEDEIEVPEEDIEHGKEVEEEDKEERREKGRGSTEDSSHEVELPVNIMQERVNQLEEQVEKLLAEKEEMAKKIEAQDAKIRAALESTLELAKILEAMLAMKNKGEEEVDEDAQGLLARLIKLIAKMMIRLVTPEDEVDEIEKKLDAA